ncbi:MAG: hypothetical protein ACLSUW_01395 [Akkermansia sp.]
MAAFLAGSALAATPAVYPSPQQSNYYPDGCFLREAFRDHTFRQGGRQQAAGWGSGKSGAYKLVISPQEKWA